MASAVLQSIGLDSWTTSNWFFVAAVALAVLAITTRLQSASSEVQLNDAKVYKAPNVPYWLPFIGHIPNMLYDGTTFLRNLRDAYTDGAYSLNFAGMTHSIVYTPSLVTALLNTKDDKASADSVSAAIGDKIFGYPMKTEKAAFDAASAEILACFSHLLNEQHLKRMVDRTAAITNQTIANLVSFSNSIVDQSYWERTANCQTVKDKNGNLVVAATLLDLIRDYCAAASNEAIIGSDLGKNYPDYLSDLWKVDRAFVLLGMGLPRWLPIPLLTRAHIARRKLLKGFAKFEEAMDKRAAGLDPGAEWSNLDDVGPVVQDRIPIYRKHNMSMQGRAAYDFAFVWASNANSNMLVFWLVVRIFADKDLLARIREEIAPYVLATQPKQELAIAEPPRLSKLDVDGLCNNCPLLKSCYVESLRVDSASWSFKIVKEDFVLSGRDKDSKSFLMKKGDFIHAAHDVHNSNPAYFPEPEKWIADRHVVIGEDGKKTASLGTIRAYGGGKSMCKGRFFAFKECMLFTAAIIAMWDIEAANGGPLKIPRARKATGVYGTSDSTRVHIRRRELPIEA